MLVAALYHRGLLKVTGLVFFLAATTLLSLLRLFFCHNIFLSAAILPSRLRYVLQLVSEVAAVETSSLLIHRQVKQWWFELGITFDFLYTAAYSSNPRL